MTRKSFFFRVLAFVAVLFSSEWLTSLLYGPRSHISNCVFDSCGMRFPIDDRKSRGRFIFNSFFYRRSDDKASCVNIESLPPGLYHKCVFRLMEGKVICIYPDGKIKSFVNDENLKSSLSFGGC